MMKKFLALLLAAIMVFGVVACGETAETTAAGEETTAAGEETTAAGEETTAAAEGGAYTTKIATPVVVTTIGQSDMNVVEQILKKVGIEYTADNQLTADAVNGGTVIMAVGGSNKGLGSAGVDANQEVERGNAIIAKAQETGAQVICMHLGGSSRRGSTSDLMIQPMVAACNYLIVAGDGDSDGQLTAWAAGVPVTTVADTKAVIDVIAALQ